MEDFRLDLCISLIRCEILTIQQCRELFRLTDDEFVTLYITLDKK